MAFTSRISSCWCSQSSNCDVNRGRRLPDSPVEPGEVPDIRDQHGCHLGQLRCEVFRVLPNPESPVNELVSRQTHDLKPAGPRRRESSLERSGVEFLILDDLGRRQVVNQPVLAGLLALRPAVLIEDEPNGEGSLQVMQLV